MRRINIGNDENNNKDDMKILLRVQGADERFDKYKKRFHLLTTLYGTFAGNAMQLYGAGLVKLDLV